MLFKSLVASFSFFGILFVANQSQAVSLQNLDFYEDLALIDRLQQIRDRELQLLRQCGLREKDWESIEVHQATYKADRLSSIEGRQFVKKSILSKIQSIRKLIPEVIQCHGLRFSQPDTMMILSPRQPIPLGNVLNLICLDPDCFRQVKMMLADLRPHCFQSLRTGLANVTENHACFAADKSIDGDLTKAFADEKQLQVFIYADVLHQEVLAARPGGQIDFDKILPEFSGVDQAGKLMSVIASISTSGNSGLTGWLQGLEDRWLIEGLMSMKTPTQVFADFKLLQQAKIRYQLSRDIIEQNKIRLFLKGHDVSGWTRHNFMAAYIACHNVNMNANYVLNLVNGLGVGYETKDFFAHWLEGISMKESVENFRSDTKRYFESGKTGLEICQRSRGQ